MHPSEHYFEVVKVLYQCVGIQLLSLVVVVCFVFFLDFVVFFSLSVKLHFILTLYSAECELTVLECSSSHEIAQKALWWRATKHLKCFIIVSTQNLISLLRLNRSMLQHLVTATY